MAKIQPLSPHKLFTDKAGTLTKDAYDFLFGIYQRIGGSLSSLNAAQLADHTWDAPNPIGSTTPATGKFTTLEATDTVSLTTVGKGISVKSGANCKLGVATLVAGTVTVSNTAVTANSVIFLTTQTPAGTLGFLRIAAITAGVSFQITSSSVTDTSTVAWFIVEKG